MALRDIKKNKAYQTRSSNPDAFNSNWTDPTAPVTTPVDSNIDQNFDQWDEFLSPTEWANVWQSFNYSTGTFANWNKPVASTKVAFSSPSTVAWPSTASNLNTAQTTATIWWRPQIKLWSQYIQDRNLEDVYDPLKKEKEQLPSFDYNTNLSNLYW